MPVHGGLHQRRPSIAVVPLVDVGDTGSVRCAADVANLEEDALLRERELQIDMEGALDTLRADLLLELQVVKATEHAAGFDAAWMRGVAPETLFSKVGYGSDQDSGLAAAIDGLRNEWSE